MQYLKSKITSNPSAIAAFEKVKKLMEQPKTSKNGE